MLENWPPARRAFAVLGMERPPLQAPSGAQVEGPQQPAFACTAAQLQAVEAELRQTYRQQSVAVHPDKCGHPLASKVPSRQTFGHLFQCKPSVLLLLAAESGQMAAATNGVKPTLVLPVAVQAFAMLSEATQVVQPLVATAAPVQTAGVAAPATPHSSSIGGNAPAANPRRDMLQVWKLPLLFTMRPRMSPLCTWHLLP